MTAFLTHFTSIDLDYVLTFDYFLYGNSYFLLTNPSGNSIPFLTDDVIFFWEIKMEAWISVISAIVDDWIFIMLLKFFLFKIVILNLLTLC